MKLICETDSEIEKEELEWEKDGRWWTGRINRLSGVTACLTPPRSVTIMDSTLREGEEVPGTVLSIEQKVDLARRLAAAGFTELEVGYAGVIDEHQDVARALRDANLPVRLASHTRIYGQRDEWRVEIDRNLEVGVDLLTMVGFVSEVGTTTTPWLKKKDVPARIADCVSYAKDKGALVSFGLADLARTRLEDIVACYQAAARAGADRLYVYDGLGATTPEAIAYLTHLIRDIGGEDREVGVHVHDTCGLATASSLRAVMAGASVVDAVPVGFGDGAGIAASEEVAVALEVLYGVKTGVDLSQLKSLCEAVARAIGVPVPETKALVGANQYRHSIDSHVAACLRGAWHSWELIRPEVLGQKRELQFGYAKLRRGKSGALYAKAQQLGFDPDERQMDEILERVRAVTLQKPYATEEEVAETVREVLAK